MIIKKIAKKVFGLLPDKITKNYQYIQIIRKSEADKSAKKYIIQEWIDSGKPVPAPNFIKQDILAAIQKQFKCDTLIETGTYIGDMIENQKGNFSNIYSIELSEFLFRKAVKRFKNYRHITIIQGDSGETIPQLLTQIEGSVMFWLDGHYSTGLTAMGNKECPIFEELNGIFSSKLKLEKVVVLIDDARLFIGENDYPTIEELKKFIGDFFDIFTLEMECDIIKIYGLTSINHG